MIQGHRIAEIVSYKGSKRFSLHGLKCVIRLFHPPGDVHGSSAPSGSGRLPPL